MKNISVVEMNNVTKKFGNIIANDKINLKVEKGEIHALIGENGAGKSTLMSILFGIYKPTSGFIKINGTQEKIKDPNHATKIGLGMVHQHFKLVGIYNAVENIILGKEPTKLSFVKFKEAEKKIQSLSNKYKLNVNLKKKIKDMTVGMQQKVEILKMLYNNSDILIFDEPTAVLTPQEINGFLKLLKDFKKQGKTILLITHKLDEIKEVADRGTIIRLGKVIGTVNIKKTSSKKISEMMVGRGLVEIKNNTKTVSKEEVLNLKNISYWKRNSKKKILNNISFSLKKGEILAIAGVEGNGQKEISEIISGLIHQKKGTIELLGENIKKMNVKKRYLGGLSYIPEDRHKHGVILDMNVTENASNKLFYQRPYSFFGILNFRRMNIFSKKLISQFDVRGTNKGKSMTRSLSGGNQQKLIVGREIMADHELLIAFQPTRGLDVGAIEYIHSKILEEKKLKKAVLLISYELDEVLSLADRIIVVNNGFITGEINAKTATKAQIGALMTRKGGN